jgi:hypothetical protein
MKFGIEGHILNCILSLFSEHFIVRELDTNCPRAYEHQTMKNVVKWMYDPIHFELIDSAIHGGEMIAFFFRPLYIHRYPLYRKLDTPQSQSGRGNEIRGRVGNRILVVQAVISHYTDSAIPAVNT